MVRAHFISVAMHIYSQCLSCGKLFIFNNENTSVRSPFVCTLCKWLALSPPRPLSTSKSIISFCRLCVRLHRTIYIQSRHTLCKPISGCPLKDIGLYKTFLLLLIYFRRIGQTLFGTALDKLLSSHMYVGYPTSFMGFRIVRKHRVTISITVKLRYVHSLILQN